MYNAFKRMRECYKKLQDDDSRYLFGARILYDLAPENLSYLRNLVGFNYIVQPVPPELRVGKRMPVDIDYGATISKAKKICEEDGEILLYGLRNTGKIYAGLFDEYNIDFKGFVSRGAERFPKGFLGKPVYSPEWLAEHTEKYIVIAADNSLGSYDQITSRLKEMDFPFSHILSVTHPYDAEVRLQYFDFIQ